MQTIMILTKDEYLIRVKKSEKGTYTLEFSKDKFKTITTREYADRKALMEVLEMQYEEHELVGI